MPAITNPTVGSDSLATLGNVVGDGTFIAKVAIAAMAIAVAVVNEDGSYYSDDTARRLYAKKVMQNPLAFSQQQITYGVISQFNCNGSTGDNTLIGYVAAIWSNLATQYA